MFDSLEKAPFKLVSLLALVPLTYLIFRGNALAGALCTTNWALHLAAMDEPQPRCNPRQLPLHLSLYAGFRYNQLSTAQARALTEVATSSTHPLIIRTLGLALIEHDQTEAAADFWRKVRFYSGLEHKTQQLVEQENYEAAKTFGRARQVLRRFDASDWQFFLAMIHAEINTTQDVDQVLALADEITTLNPALPQLYTWTGNALMEQMEYAAANRVYQAGATKFPAESGSWFGLARNALATNDTDSMCYFFEHGLRLDYSAGACNTVNEHCQEIISSEILQLCSDE